MILIEREGAVATLTMNRPQVHNAFDEELIAAMTAALAGFGDDPSVRAVVLRGAGKSFSAGADLGWMQRMAGYSQEENRADAMGLARLMRALNDCPKPTIALVQGAAFGGGVGLVAACDIALAAEGATFCLSEVRLGLIPAVISPYVVAAMGERAARRYFVTAERFSARQALAHGLVSEVHAAEELDSACQRIVAEILKGAPMAQADAKRLVADVAHQPPGEELMTLTAERIAVRRASPEGREGVAAFLAKRQPGWVR